MLALFVCIINLVSTAAIFHFLRRLSTKVVSRDYRLFAEEFLTTMDFCCGCCELAFIYDMYGIIMYGLGLFAMCLWWCESFGEAAANPNKYVEDVICGHISPSNAGRLILVELVAGSLVFSYMRSLWAIGWSTAHQHKSLERSCEADLQVSVKTGAIVEGVITFIDRLNALTLEEMDWPHSTISTAILSTALVISALHASGGYYNPVLASSLKLGCSGHSFIEFFLVYWVGSLVGSIVALTFHRSIGVKKVLEMTTFGNKLQITSKKHL